MKTKSLKSSLKRVPIKKKGAQSLTALEQEFLSPLLEIQETPPSPVKRYLLLSIVLLVTSLIIWAYFGNIEVVSTAPGKFVPDGKVKVIQPIGTGVVRAIHVTEGQEVHQGDLLLELDPTINQADLDANKKKLEIAQEQEQNARPLVKIGALSQQDYLKLKSDLASATADVTKAQELYNLQWLRAPVDGVIQTVGVATIGAVVTPAQSLITIVPKDTPLVVEATLSNEDVGFVKVGQPAEIKIDTFPFQKYGVVKGVLTWISPDAEDQSNNATSSTSSSSNSGTSSSNQSSTSNPSNNDTQNTGLVYKVHIKPNDLTMDVDGKRVSLTAGMTVKVDITTDHRRIIEFFLSPVIKYLDEGLKVR